MKYYSCNINNGTNHYEATTFNVHENCYKISNDLSQN